MPAALNSFVLRRLRARQSAVIVNSVFVRGPCRQPACSYRRFPIHTKLSSWFATVWMDYARAPCDFKLIANTIAGVQNQMLPCAATLPTLYNVPQAKERSSNGEKIFYAYFWKCQ